MPATYDSSASGVSALASSVTFSHTCNGNILYVAVLANGSNSPSGVTYGGISMANFGDDQTLNSYTISYWLLSGPDLPAPGANNIIVSYSGATADIVALSASYSNVGGSAPLGGSGEDGGDPSADGSTGGSGTTASSAVLSPTKINNLGIYFVFSLVLGTAPTSTGNKRLDVTGTLTRGAIFDLFPVTNAALTATVGNGTWWIAWTNLLSASSSIMRRLTLLGVG